MIGHVLYEDQCSSDVDEYIPYQDQCNSVVDKSVQCDLVEYVFDQFDMVSSASSDENDETQTTSKENDKTQTTSDENDNPISIVLPNASTSTALAMETNDDTDTLATEYLDEILTRIGDSPKELPVGKDIHANNAVTLNDVIQNGLKPELKDKMIIDYPIPGNCQLLKAPILNSEVKTVTSEFLQVHDATLATRQWQVGVAITALAKAMDILARRKSDSYRAVLKHVSNACKLLCDSHFIDTRLRQSCLLSTINNSLKDKLKESKRDKHLFGQSDNSKAKKNTKAINKTSYNHTKTFVSCPKPIFKIKPGNPENCSQPHRSDFKNTRLKQSCTLSTINDTLKHQLNESKRDKHLFGQFPPDNSKATKAINKTSHHHTKTCVSCQKPIFKIKRGNPENWSQPHRPAGRPSAHKNTMLHQHPTSCTIRPRFRIVYKNQGDTCR